MGRFAISFFYIIIILSVSVKYTIALIPIALKQTTIFADQKHKSEKPETAEEEKASKEDVKKSEFLSNASNYFLEKPTNELKFGSKHSELPSIFQKIPKLPPKAFYS